MIKNINYKKLIKLIFILFLIIIFSFISNIFLNINAIRAQETEISENQNTYTISFKNDNREFIRTYNIRQNDEISIPLVSQKQGYDFIGFYDEEDISLSINERYTYNKNKVFIAKYEPKTFNVNITLPNNTIKNYVFKYNSSYDFDLLNTVKGYQVVLKIDNSQIQPKGIWSYLTSDVAAEFILINYTINYEYNIPKDGGTIPENPTTYTTVDNILLKKPFKKGYRFLGYSNKNDSSSNYVLDYEIQRGSYGNLNLKAHYERTSYNITYLDVNNQFINENPNNYNYDTGTVRITNPEKNGYTFRNWLVNNEFQEGPSLYLDTSKYWQDLTLKPIYDLLEYNITYVNIEDAVFNNPNPSSYNIETQTFTLNKPDKFDLEFIGWGLNNYDTNNIILEKQITKGTTGNIILYAFYEPKKYDLIYKDNTLDLKIVKYIFNQRIKEYIPEKQGYKFIGFFTNTNLTERLPSIYQYHENKIAYAKFEIINYRINYDLFGGVLLDKKDSYNILDNFTLRQPHKNGYNFIGWIVNNNENELIKDLVFENKTGEITLKANWEPKDASKEQEDKYGKGSEIGRKRPNIFIFILVAILIVIFIFISYFLYNFYKKRKTLNNKK